MNFESWSSANTFNMHTDAAFFFFLNARNRRILSVSLNISSGTTNSYLNEGLVVKGHWTIQSASRGALFYFLHTLATTPNR